MADQTPGEKPETKPEGEPQETAKEPEAKVEKPALSAEAFAKQQEELERTKESLKKANKEAAERRIKLDEFEKAEAERKQAEMSEAEKVQARIKELETEKAERESKIQDFERKELQRKVAGAVGLPEALAHRLVGANEEEMTEDAKQLLAVLPQKQETAPEKTKAPTLKSTNPGDADKTETRAQVRERTLGVGQNPWAKGTVTMVEKE
jgi:hypothetical protein